MKKILLGVCALVLCFTVLACGQSKRTTDLWATATYKTDTELGSGAKTLTVQVAVEEKSVTFTIHTDADTVGEALLERHLIAGENSQYGMYVKSVNGIFADYAKTKTYWALKKDGADLSTGVDGETIDENAVYELVYTK